MSSFKDFSEIEQTFERAEKPAKEIEGTQISFDELFSTSFMQKYTSFSSFKELLDAGGFRSESPEDLHILSSDEFNRYISISTQFKNWQEMGDAAAACYFTEKLGL